MRHVGKVLFLISEIPNRIRVIPKYFAARMIIGVLFRWFESCFTVLGSEPTFTLYISTIQISGKVLSRATNSLIYTILTLSHESFQQLNFYDYNNITHVIGILTEKEAVVFPACSNWVAMQQVIVLHFSFFSILQIYLFRKRLVYYPRDTVLFRHIIVITVKKYDKFNKKIY